jgi:hypothetical protein
MESEFNKNSGFGDFIFELTKEIYDTALLQNCKPRDNEWTVVSSIIMEHNREFKSIVFTNGTKSLPNKNYSFSGKRNSFQISDSHAEVLALRCLKLFLLKCIQFNYYLYDFETREEINTILTLFPEYASFIENKEFFDIFLKKNKYILKESVKFHLYISDLPCGDCSVVKFENQDLNQTGSKTIESLMSYIQSNDINSKMIHDNTIGRFRTKSMRNDMDREKISLSLSCSDKIMIKNIFGIQGKFLFGIMENIYISSIIISVDDENEFKLKEKISAIKRGVNIKERDPDILIGKLNRKFLINEPEVILINKSIFKYSNIPKSDKNSTSFSIFWYYSKQIISKIDPIIGYKQGTNMSVKNIEKSRMEVCTYEIFRCFMNIIISLSNNYQNYANVNINGKFNKRIDKLISKINSLISINQSKTINLDDLFDCLANQKYIQSKVEFLKIYNLIDFHNIKMLKIYKN